MSLISAAPFEANRLYGEEVVEVHLSGELDLAVAPQLWSCLAPLAEAGDEPRQPLVLDLSALDFMDAAGFGVLVRLANRLRSTGAFMSIRSPQPLVRRVIDLADVDHVLQVEPEPAERPGAEPDVEP